MEREKKFKSGKLATFIKKNLYLILMIVCIMAIATMVTVTYINRANTVDNIIDANGGNGTNNTGGNDGDGTDVNTVVELVFGFPIEGGEVVGVFSSETLVYNATLGNWRTHEAYDIAAPVGTEVKCIYAGVVTNIYTSVLRGTEIIVTHENGMKSIYTLLDNNISVTINQKVKKGDVIGKIGEAGTFEKFKGAHLHLELFDADDVAINPANYFESQDK